jgi:hypothetical protein
MRLFLRRTKRKNGCGTDAEWKELEAHVAQFDEADTVDNDEEDGSGEAEGEGGEGKEDEEGWEDEDENEEAGNADANEEVPIESIAVDIEEERRRLDNELIDSIERQCEADDEETTDDDEEQDERSTRLEPLGMAQRQEACIMLNKVRGILIYANV